MENNINETYPVGVTMSQPQTPSRWLALATLLFMIPKLIILIPHIIALYVLGIIAVIVVVFAQIAVLFTGKYPQGLFKIVKGVFQWRLRVAAYIFGLTDKYPPFSLD